MDKLIITGGNRLSGNVKISGSKNAVLPIMAATIIVPGKYVINNVPNLRDTQTMIKLLRITGAEIEYKKNTLLIDTKNCDNPSAPYALVKTMRASFYVLGPFLSRFNYSEVSLPGGCAWGPRPLNYHLDAMKTLGAEVDLSEGMIIAKGKLNGGEINFNQQSVGATGNTLMAAVKTSGITVINNAAQEPEIEALCIFLEAMGADIKGQGTDKLIIKGKNNGRANIEYSIIPDRIEAGTFLIAGAITSGHVKVRNVNPDHLKIVIRE